MIKRLLLLSCASLLACGGTEETPQPTGITLVDKYSCRGSGMIGTTFTFQFEHTVFAMSDGSAMTTCAIVTPATQVTAFNMYKPSTEGAATGLCEVTSDSFDGTPSYGYWQLALNTAKTSSIATFVNADSTENGRTFTLGCDKR